MIDRPVTFPGYLDSVPQACAVLCLVAVLLEQLEACAGSMRLYTRQVDSLVDTQLAGCVQSKVQVVGNTLEEQADH